MRFFLDALFGISASGLVWVIYSIVAGRVWYITAGFLFGALFVTLLVYGAAGLPPKW
jgi:hypothetical protein